MSKFKVGDKVRALANPTDPYYSNDGYFKVGEEVTVKEVFPIQETVALIERGQCWHESRFELVEEPKPTPSDPSSTSFKVGDKVRRKEGDLEVCEWSRGLEVLTVEKASPPDYCQVIHFEGVRHGWDGYRFELVEEVKPAAPVVPQLPGIPEGFRAVRIGKPVKGEWYVDTDGKADQGDGYQHSLCYTILEKIDQPAPVEPPKPVEPVKPAKKVAPTFKVGDKVRMCNNIRYEKFPNGTVDTVVSINRNGINSEMDLLTFGGAMRDANGMFAYRFELVEAKPENPDDLVFQDLVPSREGIDFGWWVAPEKFDTFVPKSDTKWDMSGYYAGKMHGWATDGGRSLLAVMCYRKDLPVLPTTRTIVLNEYICWDNATPEACLVFWQTEATCGHESFASFDNERPTGNTRTVEVPIVKA